jgi:hypothetical protein
MSKERASGSTSASGTRRSTTNRQRRALGALFALLALGFAGIAVAAATSGAGVTQRVVVTVAAAAIALWLATFALRALK